MDKRALVAIVLTIIVLFAWQALFIAPEKKRSAQRRAQQIRERLQADSSAALGEQVPNGDTFEAALETEIPKDRRVFLDLSREETKEVVITVVNEKMRTVLSSAGGEIRSVKLLDFFKKDGEQVELVQDGAGGGFALYLWEGEDRRELSESIFQASINGEPADDGTVI
ncbi:MAG: hypothetical protein KAX38_01390, partial [Candidatus Krumholzibacteria bacterium]|nr:hypothetical protein [Candidatus Krumholzibacteria bacterium]